MASHTPMSDRLRLTDLMQRQEFQRLTPKQQAFVAKVVSLGVTTGSYDAVTAAQTVYHTTPKNAVVMSYELLGNRKIKAVLDAHFGRTEYESIMDDLARATRTSMARDLKHGGSLSIATIKAVQLLKSHARQNPDAGIDVLESETVSKHEPEAKVEYQIGQKITQDGVRYRVTKIDPDGSVVDAEVDDDAV
jgi:hypothetical protein